MTSVFIVFTSTDPPSIAAMPSGPLRVTSVSTSKPAASYSPSSRPTYSGQQNAEKLTSPKLIVRRGGGATGAAALGADGALVPGADAAGAAVGLLGGAAAGALHASS